MKKIKLILISLLAVFGTLFAGNDCGNPDNLTMYQDYCPGTTTYNIGTATTSTMSNPCGPATHNDWFFEFSTTTTQGGVSIDVGQFVGYNLFGLEVPLFGHISIYSSCSSTPILCEEISEYSTYLQAVSPGTTYLLRISYFDNPALNSEKIDLCVYETDQGNNCEYPFLLTPEVGSCILQEFDLDNGYYSGSGRPLDCGGIDYIDVYFEFTTNSEEVYIQTGNFIALNPAFIAVYEDCNSEIFCSIFSENNAYFVDGLIMGNNYQIRTLFEIQAGATMEICVYEPCVFYTWFADTDSDNYGDVSNSLIDCYQPMGYVADSTDCDDTNPDINPGAPEICNDIDDDCDGLIDDNDPDVMGTTRWFADNDEDDYGDLLFFVDLCRAPGDNWVEDSTDCDDNNPNINPGAQESCTGLDDDCDGLIDDDDPTIIGQDIWFADFDFDNYGDPAISVLTCDQPMGYVSDDTDCDDTNPNINPGAPDICNDIDDNCNGEVDENSIVEVIIGVNGLSLLANVAGGTPPFSYLWSTGDTTISITLAEPEDTWLWVTDAYGCIDSAFHIFTKIIAVEDLVLRIYPIPAINMLQLDFPKDIYQLDLVEIIDITGKRIFSEKNVNTSTVGRMDLSGEDPGYYTLHFMNDGKSQILKFIIMRE